MMTGLSLLWAAGAVSVRGQEPGTASSAIEGRIVHLEGSVYIHLKDHPAGQFVQAEADSPVEAGDSLVTGKDGSVSMAFDGKSLIDLGPDSDFTVDSLDPAQTELKLELGSLIAKIDHRGANEHMEFRTPTCVAAIRGTELGITQDAGGGLGRVGVFDEGVVAVRSAGSPGEVRLAANQETEVRKGLAAQPARPLRALLAQRQKMVAVRQRLAVVRSAWVRHSPSQRASFKRRLLVKPAVYKRRSPKAPGVFRPERKVTQKRTLPL